MSNPMRDVTNNPDSGTNEVLARAIVRDDEVDAQEVLNRFLGAVSSTGGSIRVLGIRVQALDDARGRVGTGVELRLTYRNSWEGNPAQSLTEALQVMGKDVLATAKVPLGPAPVRQSAEEELASPWVRR